MGRLVAQPPEGFLSFSGDFLIIKVIARISVHSYGFHLIITLLIQQTRLKWHSGQMELGRKLDRKGRGEQISVMPLWLYPMGPMSYKGNAK